jgi:hypothetical protein
MRRIQLFDALYIAGVVRRHALHRPNFGRVIGGESPSLTPTIEYFRNVARGGSDDLIASPQRRGDPTRDTRCVTCSPSRNRVQLSAWIAEGLRFHRT